MDIASLVGSGSGTGTTSSGQGAEALGSTDFMRLLTEQLKNQNPLNPTSDGEFLGQLAQWSALEESQSQSAALERLALALETNSSLQGLSQAAGLIGKQVSFYDNVLDKERIGQVEGVKFQDGLILLDIGEELVPLGIVTAIDGGTVPQTTAEEEPSSGEGEEGEETPSAGGGAGSNGTPGSGGTTGEGGGNVTVPNDVKPFEPNYGPRYLGDI